MQNKKYSVIVFDLGNVLIPFNYDLVIERFNNVEPNLGNKFLEYYKANYKIHRGFERGDVSTDEFINKMMEVLDHKIDKETFCNYYSKIFTVNKNVVELLPILKNKYKLVLLSNTDPIHKEYGWKNYEFLKYFDKLVLSYEANAVKPEQKIYKAVEDFTKLPYSEHIFIDDIADYVEGARNAGWDAVQFTGYEKLVEDLKQRKIL
ncbi:MAG: HAD family phosphatase [Bacteroidetes bacterium]|nr:HAD family phosphatase [Bacteroidota bacterium]